MKHALALLVALLAVAARAEEFSFDAAAFEKKPFEFGGYLEFKPERAWLNRDSNVNKLAGLDRRTLDRTTATLKLDAKYTQGIASFKLRADAEVRRDDLSSERINRFDEAYASFKPDPGLTLDVGKQSLKWGKGYAWNPVGFVERPKDPNDVELAREGYTMVAADFIRNFDGDLKTVAFTPVLLPVGSQTNPDFGGPNHVNAAAKLYLLWLDTDIDFTWLSRGSRTPRFGVDFSRNLSSALEVHGEWARSRDADRDRTSGLAGLRYLTERDTTWIAEFYRNGTGATPKRTLYLRASQKEPFDIVYFTPSLTLIANLGDRSFSLTPELLYTGVTNLDLRLRASWLKGGAGSEFGEKQNTRKLELMMRYYF